MSQLSLRSLSPCFASPILTFRLENAAELNSKLLAEVGAMRSNSEGITRSNQNGWHSETDFFKRQEAACKTLSDHLIRSVILATRATAPNFEWRDKSLEVEGWANINGRSAYNSPHTHPGYSWSGSYYVSVPANAVGRSGMIEFLDPRSNAMPQILDDSDFFVSKKRIAPQAGDLLIFPSHLSHWVYPNEQDEERVSVAFNARFGTGPRKRKIA